MGEMCQTECYWQCTHHETSEVETGKYTIRSVRGAQRDGGPGLPYLNARARGREVEADHEMKSISGGSTRWCDWNGHHLVTLQVDAPGAPNVQTCRVQSSSRTD